MRILLGAVATASLVVAAGSVSAQTLTEPKITASVGYSHYSADNTSLGTVTGRIGARLHPNLGVEGEASFGVNDDIAQSILFKDNIKLKYDAAAYGVAYLPISDRFEVFGRLGYGTTDIEAEHKDKKISVGRYGAGQSINYGVGANYYFTDSSGVRVDWTRRDSVKGPVNADVYSVSYTHRF